MISYLFLLIISIIILLIAVFVFRQKIYAPAVLFVGGYILSIILSIVGLKTWNTVEELSPKTIAFILLTLVAFSLGAIIPSKIIAKQSKTRKYDTNKVIYLDTALLIMGSILLLVQIALIVKDLDAICSGFSCGASSIFEKMRFYHDNSALFATGNKVASYSRLTERLFMINKVLSLFNIYILFNNLSRKEPFRKNIPVAILILLYMFASFIRGGRSGILEGLSSIFAMFVFSGIKISNKTQKQIIRKIIPAIFVVMAAFYAVLPVMGKETDRTMSEYVSAYLGCSIPSLNIALESNISQNAKSPIDNSLYGLRSYAQKLGFENNAQERSLPFIRIGGFATNVYTSIFRLYDDFGIQIALILIMISGIFFGVTCKMAEQKNDYRFVVFYIWLASKMIDMCRDETFYTLVLSPSTVLLVILIVVLAYIMNNFAANNQIVKHEKK